MKPTLINGAVFCAFLAGCGSDDAATFGSLSAGAADLSAQAGALGASTSTDIPTTGTASYSGFIGLDLGYNDVAGELDMTVDFAADTVTGSANNFVSASNIAYAGSLDVTGGFIDRTADTALSDPHLFADLDGTVSSDGISSTIDGQLRGTFFGPGREIVSGHVSGTVTNQFGASALNSANSSLAASKN